MKQIAVIGAGAMGSGIAQVAAMHGCEVRLYDSFEASIQKARESILTSLNKLVEKNKFTDTDAKSIFGRIYFIDRLESIAGSELIIEAIVEQEEEKKKLFTAITPFLSADTIVASNTSSLSITSLARYVPHPENFIGIHFFNPAVLMKLVEVIPALQTKKELTKRVLDLMISWNKVPVVAKDTPGFIVNRLARAFYGEALRIAEEQLATPMEIDAAMKTLGGFKMGPFELMDFIGLDINYAVTHSVWSAMYYDPRYKPSLMQASLVKAGWLGKKSGKGFYVYPIDDSVLPLATDDHLFILERILTMLINEAADALYLGIASRDDLDLAMTLGVNYPKGLLSWADEIGIDTCVKCLDDLHAMYHEDRYRCSPLLRIMVTLNQTFYA